MTKEEKKQQLQILREVYLGNAIVCGGTVHCTVTPKGITGVVTGLTLAEIQAAALRQIQEIEEAE